MYILYVPSTYVCEAMSSVCNCAWPSASVWQYTNIHCTMYIWSRTVYVAHLKITAMKQPRCLTRNGAPETCMFQHISCMEATFIRFPCMFQDISCMEYTFMHVSWMEATTMHFPRMKHAWKHAWNTHVSGAPFQVGYLSMKLIILKQPRSTDLGDLYRQIN